MNYFHAENVELSQLVKKRELLSPGNCIKIPGNDSDWPCLDDTSSLEPITVAKELATVIG